MFHAGKFLSFLMKIYASRKARKAFNVARCLAVNEKCTKIQNSCDSWGTVQSNLKAYKALFFSYWLSWKAFFLSISDRTGEKNYLWTLGGSLQSFAFWISILFFCAVHCVWGAWIMFVDEFSFKNVFFFFFSTTISIFLSYLSAPVVVAYKKVKE